VTGRASLGDLTGRESRETSTRGTYHNPVSSLRKNLVAYNVPKFGAWPLT
jgi:hypothetical protein